MTPLLQVDELRVEYRTSAGRIAAVDGVSLDVGRRETVALVGESGSGKSSFARAVARLVPACAGSVTFDGVDLLRLRGSGLRGVRRRFQVVFQDPGGSLNERMTVGALIEEPLVIHLDASRQERRKRVGEMLELVGLDPRAAGAFPHQFSGGQRQRIALARALAVKPELLIADEPTSALDVSVQGQILLLLRDLRERLELSVLLISHDLAVVRALADRVAVMYLGQLVEVGPRTTVYSSPRHPYTRALLASAPRMSDYRPRLLEGEVPSALALPRGCRFRTRCPLAHDRCAVEAPALREVEGRLVACHAAEAPDQSGNGRATASVSASRKRVT